MTSSDKPNVIVVGLDYSEVSHLALRQAFEAAGERPRTEVHVLHVQTAVEPYSHMDPALRPAGDEVLVRALDRVQRVVRDQLASFQTSRLGLGTKPFGLVSHVRSGSPAEEISQLADDLRADLVIVGTHGRSGVARLLLGSVAHAVVTHAPCPVLVVRDKRFGRSVPRNELSHASGPGALDEAELNPLPDFDRN